MPKADKSGTLKFLKRKPLLAAGIAAVLMVAWLLRSGNSPLSGDDAATFEVRRGPLSISVLEGGNIHALESHEHRSVIKTSSSMSGTKILSIIEEGYEITEEDVKDGKILVELDSGKIKERIFSQEVEFQSDLAAYAETQENLAIQASENQSSIKDIRQQVRFSLLDFEKYLGTSAASELLKERELPYDVETLAAFEQDYEREMANGDDETGEAPKAQEETIADSAATVDFLKYIEGDDLGDGEAQQIIRGLRDKLLVAQNETALTQENIEGSRRLAQKNFITQTTLENELVNLEKIQLAAQTAETELELFRKYVFPKTAEEALSSYEESLERLKRTKRAAKARMAQAEARFRTAERRYQLELKEKEDLEYQLEGCVIRAEVPGLVAYGGSETNYYKSRYYDAIAEGAEVRFGQPIITIPNMSKMAVSVNVHESYIKKVAIGQPARINLDAEPGITLEGSVAELAVLPDSANLRYNPNLKVYPASIHISGNNEWLKPGMSAKVEIIIEEIPETLYVPVQAIFVEDDQHYCYVARGSRAEKRLVDTGQFNDEFIQIIDGLKEGDNVFLSTPEGIDAMEVPARDKGKTLAGT